MYFSATIFSLVGFNSPIGTSLLIALTNFIFTLVAFRYIDVIGRRNILLRSIPVMVIGLLTCSVAFLFIHPREPESLETEQFQASSSWSIVLLLSMILYVAAYAVGLGCVPWQQSELFPLRVRSLGSGLATTTNWSSNFIIGMTFLPMMSLMGSSATFLLYGIVCFVGWFFIYTIYPETAGMELEDIGELLKDGWGVQQSLRDFQRRRIDSDNAENS
jgi:SP family myo-inositol transporter-like MFS transporter 13